MANPSTTRRWLLGLGGATAVTAIAGCAGDGNDGDGNGTDDGGDDEEAPETNESDGNETGSDGTGDSGGEDDGNRAGTDTDGNDTDGNDTEENGTDKDTDGNETDEEIGDEELTVETTYDSRAEYARPGESFDDFEDLSAWSITEGEAEIDDDVVFAGSRSVRLFTDEEGENMVIERDLEGDNPDLTDLDFSMAVRTPTPGNIAVELRFVDIYGSSRIHQLPSIAYRTRDVGWFRTAPGVFEEDEYPPEMDSLDRLEVRIHHTGEEAEVWVDDIRIHEKPDSGYVVLGWDDGLRSFYEEVAPLHDEYGVDAVQSVVRQWTSNAREDVMTRGELLERQEAGDQIVAHGTHARFAEMDPDELREALETDKQWAVNSGFEGAHFITFPHNSFDATVLDVVSDYYYAGGYNQAGGVNLTAVYGFDPLVLPRTIGHDLEICRQCVDHAAAYSQCTVLNFHDFELDNTLDRDEYDQLLEHIDGIDDVEVITLNELWRMRREGH